MSVASNIPRHFQPYPHVNETNIPMTPDGSMEPITKAKFLLSHPIDGIFRRAKNLIDPFLPKDLRTKRALILTANVDDNGGLSLSSLNPRKVIALGQIENNYNTTYKRISDVPSLCKTIDDETHKKGPIHVLIIRAHGEQDSMQLDRNSYFSVGDSLPERSCLHNLDSEATIVLEGCSTGEGMWLEQNLANYVACHSPSRAKIFAATYYLRFFKITKIDPLDLHFYDFSDAHLTENSKLIDRTYKIDKSEYMFPKYCFAPIPAARSTEERQIETSDKVMSISTHEKRKAIEKTINKTPIPLRPPNKHTMPRVQSHPPSQNHGDMRSITGDLLHAGADTITTLHIGGVHLPKRVEVLGAVAGAVGDILHNPTDPIIENLVCKTGVNLLKETVDVSVAATITATLGVELAFAPQIAMPIIATTAIASFKGMQKITAPVARVVEQACHNTFKELRQKKADTDLPRPLAKLREELREHVQEGMLLVNIGSIPIRMVGKGVEAFCTSGKTPQKICSLLGRGVDKVKEAIPASVKKIVRKSQERIIAGFERECGIHREETSYFLESAGLLMGTKVAGTVIQTTKQIGKTNLRQFRSRSHKSSTPRIKEPKLSTSTQFVLVKEPKPNVLKKIKIDEYTPPELFNVEKQLDASVTFLKNKTMIAHLKYIENRQLVGHIEATRDPLLIGKPVSMPKNYLSGQWFGAIRQFKALANSHGAEKLILQLWPVEKKLLHICMRRFKHVDTFKKRIDGQLRTHYNFEIPLKSSPQIIPSRQIVLKQVPEPKILSTESVQQRTAYVWNMYSISPLSDGSTKAFINYVENQRANLMRVLTNIRMQAINQGSNHLLVELEASNPQQLFQLAKKYPYNIQRISENYLGKKSPFPMYRFDIPLKHPDIDILQRGVTTGDKPHILSTNKIADDTGNRFTYARISSLSDQTSIAFLTAIGNANGSGHFLRTIEQLKKVAVANGSKKLFVEWASRNDSLVNVAAQRYQYLGTITKNYLGKTSPFPMHRFEIALKQIKQNPAVSPHLNQSITKRSCPNLPLVSMTSGTLFGLSKQNTCMSLKEPFQTDRPQQITTHRTLNEHEVTQTLQKHHARIMQEVEIYRSAYRQSLTRESSKDLTKSTLRNEEEYRRFRSTLSDGFDGLAATLRLGGKPQRSQDILQFGSGAVTLMDSCYMLATGSSLLGSQMGLFAMASPIAPYVGLIQAAALLLPLFKKKKKRDDEQEALRQAIIQAFQQLAHQLAQVHKDMFTAFSHLENQIDKVQLEALRRFLKLEQELREGFKEPLVQAIQSVQQELPSLPVISTKIDALATTTLTQPLIGPFIDSSPQPTVLMEPIPDRLLVQATSGVVAECEQSIVQVREQGMQLSQQKAQIADRLTRVESTQDSILKEMHQISHLFEQLLFP